MSPTPPPTPSTNTSTINVKPSSSSSKWSAAFTRPTSPTPTPSRSLSRLQTKSSSSSSSESESALSPDMFTTSTVITPNDKMTRPRSPVTIDIRPTSPTATTTIDKGSKLKAFLLRSSDSSKSGSPHAIHSENNNNNNNIAQRAETVATNKNDKKSSRTPSIRKDASSSQVYSSNTVLLERSKSRNGSRSHHTQQQAHLPIGSLNVNMTNGNSNVKNNKVPNSPIRMDRTSTRSSSGSRSKSIKPPIDMTSTGIINPPSPINFLDLRLSRSNSLLNSVLAVTDFSTSTSTSTSVSTSSSSSLSTTTLLTDSFSDSFSTSMFDGFGLSSSTGMSTTFQSSSLSQQQESPIIIPEIVVTPAPEDPLMEPTTPVTPLSKMNPDALDKGFFESGGAGGRNSHKRNSWKRQSLHGKRNSQQLQHHQRLSVHPHQHSQQQRRHHSNGHHNHHQHTGSDSDSDEYDATPSPIRRQANMGNNNKFLVVPPAFTPRAHLYRSFSSDPPLFRDPKRESLHGALMKMVEGLGGGFAFDGFGMDSGIPEEEAGRAGSPGGSYGDGIADVIFGGGRGSRGNGGVLSDDDDDDDDYNDGGDNAGGASYFFSDGEGDGDLGVMSDGDVGMFSEGEGGDGGVLSDGEGGGVFSDGEGVVKSPSIKKKRLFRMRRGKAEVKVEITFKKKAGFGFAGDGDGDDEVNGYKREIRNLKLEKCILECRLEAGRIALREAESIVPTLLASGGRGGSGELRGMFYGDDVEVDLAMMDIDGGRKGKGKSRNGGGDAIKEDVGGDGKLVICRNVVCRTCFIRENWDWDQAVGNDNWSCPHCTDQCPVGSHCHIKKIRSLAAEKAQVIFNDDEDEDDEKNDDDPNDDICGVCRKHGELICCDGCPLSFHQKCANLATIPEGEWFCEDCVVLQAELKHNPTWRSRPVVLSLFDGIGAAYVALRRLGVAPSVYISSEIDATTCEILESYVSSHSKDSENPTKLVHIGDVKQFKPKRDLPMIMKQCGVSGSLNSNTPIVDLLVGGSPCTDLSFLGQGAGVVEGSQSSFFFEYVRVLSEVRPRWFLFENVRMRFEDRDIISKELGVQPVYVDSIELSPCRRRRLFWTNIPIRKIPETLQDRPLTTYEIVLDDAVPECKKAKCITTGNTTPFLGDSRFNVLWYSDGKRRSYHPVELERLMGFPDFYTELARWRARHAMLGNSFNVYSVAHILGGLFKGDVRTPELEYRKSTSQPAASSSSASASINSLKPAPETVVNVVVAQPSTENAIESLEVRNEPLPPVVPKHPRLTIGERDKVRRMLRRLQKHVPWIRRPKLPNSLAMPGKLVPDDRNRYIVLANISIDPSYPDDWHVAITVPVTERDNTMPRPYYETKRRVDIKCQPIPQSPQSKRPVRIPMLKSRFNEDADLQTVANDDNLGMNKLILVRRFAYLSYHWVSMQRVRLLARSSKEEPNATMSRVVGEWDRFKDVQKALKLVSREGKIDVLMKWKNWDDRVEIRVPEISEVSSGSFIKGKSNFEHDPVKRNINLSTIAARLEASTPKLVAISSSDGLETVEAIVDPLGYTSMSEVIEDVNAWIEQIEQDETELGPLEFSVSEEIRETFEEELEDNSEVWLSEGSVVMVDPEKYLKNKTPQIFWPCMIVPLEELDKSIPIRSSKEGFYVVCYFEDNSFSIVPSKCFVPFDPFKPLIQNNANTSSMDTSTDNQPTSSNNRTTSLSPSPFPPSSIRSESEPTFPTPPGHASYFDLLISRFGEDNVRSHTGIRRALRYVTTGCVPLGFSWDLWGSSGLYHSRPPVLETGQGRSEVEMTGGISKGRESGDQLNEVAMDVNVESEADTDVVTMENVETGGAMITTIGLGNDEMALDSIDSNVLKSLEVIDLTRSPSPQAFSNSTSKGATRRSARLRTQTAPKNTRTSATSVLKSAPSYTSTSSSPKPPELAIVKRRRRQPSKYDTVDSTDIVETRFESNNSATITTATITTNPNPTTPNPSNLTHHNNNTTTSNYHNLDLLADFTFDEPFSLPPTSSSSPSSSTSQPYFCRKCFVTKTVKWRTGPDGRNTLCNDCELKLYLNTVKRVPVSELSHHRFMKNKDKSKNNSEFRYYSTKRPIPFDLWDRLGGGMLDPDKFQLREME
ncbi:hypothetical protein HDU76_012801 [Blyttiomyces sp. JEL0837]|nr:hypothetical protein HDU76_012801 [Blyttiomyces sp. JEL0837]